MTTGLALAESVGILQITAERCRDVIEVIPLTTPEEEQHAAKFVRALETVIKKGEADRKALVAPMKDAAKAIDEAYREPRRELEKLSARLRARLQEVAQAREIARLQALEEARKAETAVEANAALATVQEAPETPGVSMRWRWEIAGMRPEEIPRAFLCVDVAKLQAVCKDADKNGQEPKVPGVVFERRAHATVRKLT